MNLVQCIISRHYMCDKKFRAVLCPLPSHQILTTPLYRFHVFNALALDVGSLFETDPRHWPSDPLIHFPLYNSCPSTSVLRTWVSHASWIPMQLSTNF